MSLSCVAVLCCVVFVGGAAGGDDNNQTTTDVEETFTIGVETPAPPTLPLQENVSSGETVLSPAPPENETVGETAISATQAAPLKVSGRPTFLPKTLKAGRRKPRRPRGHYNDFRYRNREYNPYNPNSPFSFRGRPAPPANPGTYYDPRYRMGYENQYYDPYSQAYYGYPAYAPGYYGYPYPAQPQPPQPTPPVTERIPDLYYVQKADTPDGQYEYKKMRVVQDGPAVSRRRPRATMAPQQGYGQGYYYQYDPYNRRPPPPPQPYYNQPYYNYPQQPAYSPPRTPWPQAPRYRSRTGRPPLRPAAVFASPWVLTSAPNNLGAPSIPPAAEQATQASG